jgi:hypothetical protein
VDETEVHDLVPGECKKIAAEPFFNNSDRPCDDPCCVENDPPEQDQCLNCTKILEASVQVIATKPHSEPTWQPVEPSTICAIANGSSICVNSTQCRVINTCAGNGPHDWSITPTGYCNQLGQ